MSNLVCPLCHTEIPPDRLKRKRGLAHCPHCQTPLTLAPRSQNPRQPTYA
jgi:hypothetical protein